MVLGSTNPERARGQHARLLKTVVDLGARVEELPFVHGAFDSVFAKDNAIYCTANGGLRAILASPRHRERQIEQAARAAALRSRGATVAPISDVFEGGDVVVDAMRRIAYLGHGFRSTPDAAKSLAVALDMPVVAVELVDPMLYHLDTALAVLDDGVALLCEEAFTPASREILRAAFDVVVSISRDEAVQLALNFVEVGSTIVTGSGTPAVRSVLRALGKDVVVLPLDEFQRAGGSAACLLGRVHELAVADALRSSAA
jgi:N-dimethylarginine dimethylaminohydrolase